MNATVLLVALAGIALSGVLDLWLPTWAGSLAGLALVVGLIVARRRRGAAGSEEAPPP